MGMEKDLNYEFYTSSDPGVVRFAWRRFFLRYGFSLNPSH